MTVRNAASMPAGLSEWEARGYHGSGNVKELIGSLAGRSALVCGSGAGVFEEVEAAQAVLEEPVIFACNDVGMFLPHVDHYVSLHTDNLAAWKSVRWLNCQSTARTVYHGVDPKPFVDYHWSRLTPTFCLSGYFGMQLAWLMGCERIVLCGCPGTQTKRFFEARLGREHAGNNFGYGNSVSNGDQGIRQQLEQEMRRLPLFKAAVRSMSGWTQSFFGGIESWQLLPHSPQPKLALLPR